MTFSIITATYNSLETLKETYASLASQTEKDWQWVVVDGASSDGTQAWLKALDEKRLHWVSESDGGIYEALNKGLVLAQGAYIGFLHSDDVYTDNEVLSYIKRAFDDIACQGIYGDLVYFKIHKNTPTRTWKSSPFQQSRTAWGWMPPHPTLYLKKEVYDLVGGFDPSYRIAADYEFMLRLFQQNITINYLPKTLVAMRQGGISSASKNQWIKSKEDWRALKFHGYRFAALRVAVKLLRKLHQFSVQ
jgi:glycosyltransferase involved in cell wall biosynthesis